MKILTNLRAAFLRWWHNDRMIDLCSQCEKEHLIFSLVTYKSKQYCVPCYRWYHGEGGEVW